MAYEHLTVPKVVKARGHYWIPPCPPNLEVWHGPYDPTPEGLEEAREDRRGLEHTINSPEWRMMFVEWEDEFDETWERFEQELQNEQEESAT